jgi:hypothetical protein
MPVVTPTPTAPFSDKIHSLGFLLTECVIWRTQSGLLAGDTDAETKLLGEGSATRNIFYPRKEDDALLATLLDGRPAAVISPVKRWYATYAGGAQNYLTHSRGVLLLIVMDRDRVAADLEQSARTFENFWGSLIGEIAAQSGDDTKLVIETIEEDQPPQREPLAEEKHYWLASAHIFYGLWPELAVR